MEERAFKGIWIPKEIWLSTELNLQEKVFLVEIDSLDNQDGCFASNSYFSEFFGISNSRVSQVINLLKEKGYISVEYEKKGKEIIKRIIKVKRPPYPYLENQLGYLENERGYLENCKGGIKFSKGGYLENAKDNNTYINNTSINNTSISKEYKAIIEEYTSNEELLTSLKAFIDMRKHMDKSFTPHALRLALNKLDKLSNELGNGDASRIELVNDSVEHGWKSFYISKDKNKPKNNWSFMDF